MKFYVNYAVIGYANNENNTITVFPKYKNNVLL